MAHTEKELKSYKDKAQELTSIFGEKSLDAVEQIATTLENLLAWDDSEFTAVELGYWYNVEAELKKEPEEEFLKYFEFLSAHFIYNPKTFCFKSRRKQNGGSVGDDRNLYIDNTGGSCLIYWINNRGQEDTIFDGKELKTEEEFNQVFELLGIKEILKWT